MLSKHLKASFVLIVACALLLSACSSVSYYSQSIVGHSRIMLARQPIKDVLTQGNIDEELKQQLELVAEIRQYSIDKLALPKNDSYSDYVDLKRDYPVWTVVAAKEFSVEAKSWCYPIIGCANYRGYFSEMGAMDYAKSLVEKGYETSIGGAPAYSTLGWFDDPILPSMLRYGAVNLAESIFHELAHQQLYINGDSNFNEAFATVVGEQGTIRWLQDKQPELLKSYQKRLLVRDDFSNLVMQLKNKLRELYRTELRIEVMKEVKLKMFIDFKDEYELMKSSRWEDKNWFESWFDQAINNARLAGFATYRGDVPDILKLFKKCNSDFSRFYKTVGKLEFSASGSDEKLNLLSNTGCVVD